jgi:hypothetical protein
MLGPWYDIAYRLPIMPNPFSAQAMQAMEEEVEAEQQLVTPKFMFVAQEPDLETVVEVSEESDVSSWSSASDSEFLHDSSATSA